MKKTTLFILLAIITVGTLTAQNNCSKYYPMKEGSTLQYTLHNGKGKVSGTTDYSITDVKNIEEGTSATFHLQFNDAKGKKELESEYGIICTGSGIIIDFMSLMPAEMMKQYEKMDMKIDYSGTDIELPNDLSVGQELNDANVTMNMSMSGINMNISVAITDRTVDAKETITTEAGTFDCYQLSETLTSTSMGVNIEFTSKTWLSEGVGMIKNEVFKKNGKAEGSTVLTKYSK